MIGAVIKQRHGVKCVWACATTIRHEAIGDLVTWLQRIVVASSQIWIILRNELRFKARCIDNDSGFYLLAIIQGDSGAFTMVNEVLVENIRTGSLGRHF